MPRDEPSDQVMDSVSSDDLLQNYSDAELMQRFIEAPSFGYSSRLCLLSADLIAKYYEPPEVEDVVETMEFAQRLGIRTPSIKRVIKHEGNAYCIMDRVEGSTLDHVWANLSWFLTIKLALQLRYIIKRLRSVTSSTAGSLVSGECRSFWLDDRFGIPPNSKSEDVACFLRFWDNFTGMRKAMQAAKNGTMLDFKENPRLEPNTFVFTHHDLAPRNLLLTPSDELCLLDWDFAGFYPIYFENASMQNFDMPKEWSVWARLRWYLFTLIAVGRYEQNARVLRHIRSKFTQFPVGRRFELLKLGGPHRYPVS